MAMDKQGLPTKIYRDIADLKSIKIFAWKGTDFTAEDLLNVCSPFGYVVSVQKIMENGFASGVVTYSKAEDAATAMMELRVTTDYLVHLLVPTEVREALKIERSESPRDKPSCLIRDRFSDMPPQKLPKLLDTLNPPAYSQSVCLRICGLPKHADERHQVLSLLPPSTIDVKVERKTALVTLPDTSAALWFMDLLSDLYTGSKRLHVSFANQSCGHALQ